MQNLSQVWWLWDWWGAGGSSLLSWAGSREGIDSMGGMSWTLLTHSLHREQIQHWKQPQGLQKYRSLDDKIGPIWFNFFIFLKVVDRKTVSTAMLKIKNVGKNSHAVCQCAVPDDGYFLLRKPSRELKQLTVALSSSSCFWEEKGWGQRSWEFSKEKIIAAGILF